MQESIKLLERIAFLTIGSSLISDLKTIESPSAHMQMTLRRIDPADFSLHEWQDAVEYLTGRTLPAFETVEAAHKYLVNFYHGKWAWDI